MHGRTNKERQKVEESQMRKLFLSFPPLSHTQSHKKKKRVSTICLSEKCAIIKQLVKLPRSHSNKTDDAGREKQTRVLVSISTKQGKGQGSEIDTASVDENFYMPQRMLYSITASVQKVKRRKKLS
jgi:hypothetical protein